MVDVSALFGQAIAPAPYPPRGLVEAQHHDILARLKQIDSATRLVPLQLVQLRPGLSYITGPAIEKTGFIFLRYLRWWHMRDRKLRLYDDVVHGIFRNDCLVALIHGNGNTVATLAADSRIWEPFVAVGAV